MSPQGYSLQQIAEHVAGQLVGDGTVRIVGVAPLSQAGPGHISFAVADKPKYVEDLRTTGAAAVVVSDAALADGRPCIVVRNPVASFDKILALFPTPQSPPPAGVHPAAHVDPSTTLGEGVSIGPGAVIQANCRIGRRTIIWPNVFIGPDCVIGDDCVLHPGVVLREQTVLGQRVTIHPNAVLGADGFGYRQVKSADGNVRHVKVPQVGCVVVGDDVEIGANTAIDRAKFGATRIGDGTKIDNLCQIAHNVQIGEHCLIAALAGIAGSVDLGHHVVLAGKVGVSDHVTLGPGCVVTACSCVLRDFPAGSQLGGRSAKDHRTNMREMVLTARLPELFERVSKLEKRAESADNP